MIAFDRAPQLSPGLAPPDRVVTLALDGELGLSELSQVGDELFRSMHHGRKRIVLDLTHVSHIDYRGIRALVTRVDLFRRAGGDIKIAGASPYLRAIFRAGGAHAAFELHPTVPEARAAFDPPRFAVGS